MAIDNQGYLQYVGPRFVPKFADPIEWDKTRQYEGLSIVLYNGDTYTSKKLVPPGIEITNTEYWVITGNFNGAIGGVQNQVNDLNANVQDLAGKVQAAEDSVDAVENTVSEVEGRVDALEQTVGGGGSGSIPEQLNAIKTDIANIRSVDAKQDNNIAAIAGDVGTLVDRTYDGVIVISDSYGGSPDASVSFIPLFKGYAGLTKPNQFWSSWVSGAGFTISGKEFLAQLQDVLAAMPEGVNHKIGRIYVVGGANDTAAAYGTITSKIAEFCQFASQNFPNAKIFAGCCAQHAKNNQVRSKIVTTVIPAYEQMARYGHGCIPINAVLHRISYLGTDGLHPSTTGAARLAMALTAFHSGGPVQNDYLFNQMTPDSKITVSSGSFGWIETLNGNLLSISNLNGAVFNIENAEVTENNDYWLIKMGTVNDTMMFGQFSGYSAQLDIIISAAGENKFKRGNLVKLYGTNEIQLQLYRETAQQTRPTNLQILRFGMTNYANLL